MSKFIQSLLNLGISEYFMYLSNFVLGRFSYMIKHRLISSRILQTNGTHFHGLKQVNIAFDLFSFKFHLQCCTDLYYQTREPPECTTLSASALTENKSLLIINDIYYGT